MMLLDPIASEVYVVGMSSRSSSTSMMSLGIDLLPDEDADLRDEVGKFVDDPDLWLATPNTNFGGFSPADMVGRGHEADVRNLLREIKYIGMS